jgi:cyanophycin synthetase
VEINLRTPEEVRWGSGRTREHGRAVIVEQHCQSHDRRILVVGGRVVAVAERVPAHVTGDGLGTVAAPVALTSRDPRRGEGHESVLTRISLDECVERFVAREGRTLDSAPAPGEMVHPRPTANLSIKVEAAVLEAARGGLLREDLRFDRADVGAVLNVSADHLGLQGRRDDQGLGQRKVGGGVRRAPRRQRAERG